MDLIDPVFKKDFFSQKTAGYLTFGQMPGSCRLWILNGIFSEFLLKYQRIKTPS